MIRTLAATAALVGSIALVPGAASAQSQTSDRAEPTVTDHRPHDRGDELRFACHARRSDRGPVIGCHWTPVSGDRVAGYKLWRVVDDGPRRVVFATRNNRQSGYRELVRPGHRYHYAVQYVGFNGEVLHTSHAERISIPGPDAERDA